MSAPRLAPMHPAVVRAIRSPRSRPPPRRRPNYRARRLLVAGVVVAFVAVVIVPLAVAEPAISVEGVADGDALGVPALGSTVVTVSVNPSSAADGATARLDGTAVEVAREGNRLTWQIPAELGEGEHAFAITAGEGWWKGGDSTTTVSFTVDTTAPELVLDDVGGDHPVDQPLTIRGRTEPGSAVSVGAATAQADGDGRFEVTLPRPPIGLMDVRSVDRAGNGSSVRSPTGVSLPALRAVHMSATSWTVARLRDPVLEMADRGQINAIQLDLKDESGAVGHRTDVTTANEIGAAANLYELNSAVDEIHSRGLRVVGRIVVYRDPKLTESAVAAGRTDELVLTADGAPYKGSYGGFANPASDTVSAYNRDLAVEAARAGVDDILFDYIRRPEGSLDSMQFPGATGPIENAVVAFLAEVGDALADTPARLGISVFGIAAKNPEQIAQPIDAMAAEVDYIAPMVYPSHWGPGWYDVADPNGQPYDIVSRSLQDFQGKIQGTDAKLVPWLQDFDLGRSYGDAEVAAQVKATNDLGIDSWLMWDPNVTYHAGGLPRP